MVDQSVQKPTTVASGKERWQEKGIGERLIKMSIPEKPYGNLLFKLTKKKKIEEFEWGISPKPWVIKQMVQCL